MEVGDRNGIIRDGAGKDAPPGSNSDRSVPLDPVAATRLLSFFKLLERLDKKYGQGARNDGRRPESGSDVASLGPRATRRI
jgi:hypothetical protein